jgi:hypothetical protein
MYKSLLLFFLVSFFVPFANQLLAQTNLPVMNNPNEEIFRRKQLTVDTGKYSLADVSFMVRPVTLIDKAFTSRKLNFKILPVQFIQQFNSQRPLAYTDGSMFPTRGWQFN